MDNSNSKLFQYEAKIKPLFTSAARFVGYPIMGLGILALLSSLFNLLTEGASWLQLITGPIFIGLGYIMATSYEGVRIDGSFMRYRNFNWIAGIHQGEWMVLPTIVRITVTPFKATHILHNAISPSIRVSENGLYRVLLCVQNSQIGIIAAIDKQDKAIANAEALKQIFDVELLISQ